MDNRTFLDLPTPQVADLVKQSGLKVVVFVVNGTRRWYLLEHQLKAEGYAPEYLESIARRLVELCKMFFDHGVETLVMPTISPYILDKRGEAYTRMAIEGLDQLTSHPAYRAFYDDYDVRVRFYGDYQKYLDAEASEYLHEKFVTLAENTQHHQKHRLCWGVCAHDALQTVAENTIKYFEKTGEVPTTDELIEMYYGEKIPPVDLYISSSKPRAFDMPLISTGRESLYHTVAPSPYLTQNQFREILHDHIFNRSASNMKSLVDESEHWQSLKAFYEANQGKTLGVGARNAKWDIWYPTPQVLDAEE